MTSAFSWQNYVSLCPASFSTPRPNLTVFLGISLRPTFVFQSSMMKKKKKKHLFFWWKFGFRKCFGASSSPATEQVITTCPGKNIGMSCHFLLQCMKLKSESEVTQSCPTLIQLFATPWIAARQASLSITNSRSSLRLNVHWVSDAIQPSHPLSSPSPPAPNPSQHQSLFQWVNSSHEVAKVLEFQL